MSEESEALAIDCLDAMNAQKLHYEREIRLLKKAARLIHDRHGMASGSLEMAECDEAYERASCRGDDDSLDEADAELVQLREENRRLREALQRAAAWGISSAGFDANAACELEDWVKGGMIGELPELHPHLVPNA